MVKWNETRPIPRRLGHDHLSIDHRGRPSTAPPVQSVMPRCSPSKTRSGWGVSERRKGCRNRVGEDTKCWGNWCKVCLFFEMIQDELLYY